MIAALNLILPPRPTRWGQTQSPLTAANDNCYLYLVGECSRGTLQQHSRSPAFHIHKLAYNSDPEEKTDYIGKVARITTSGGVDTITYLHADQIGSANTGTTSTGAISWREQYTPFGRTLTSPLVNNYQAGFTGHIKDSATGLNYMQARYYDSLIGRFLSTDPIGFSPKRPEMFGRYTYVNNNPVNGVDPDGKAPFDQFNSIDNAAVDLLQYAAQQGARNDGRVKRERGGDILQIQKTGKYYYNDVQVGTNDEVRIEISRSKTVAAAHLHPPKKGGKGLEDSRNDRSNDGRLSRQDKRMIKAINKATGKKLPHYLGSADGSVTKFTFKEKRAVTGTRIRKTKTIKFKIEKKVSD